MPATMRDYHDGLKAHKRGTPLSPISFDEIDHPLDERCNDAIRCNGIFGTRESADILMAVAHGTQSPSAGHPGSAHQTIRYFALSTTTGGAQLIIDGNTCYRGAKDSEITAGVSDVNDWTLHFEMASIATWTRLTWFLPFNRRMLQRAAWKMAQRMREHGIPNVFWTRKMLDNRGHAAVARKTKMGWTLHRNLSNSGLSSSTHQDPWPAHTVVAAYFKRQVTRFFEDPSLTA